MNRTDTDTIKRWLATTQQHVKVKVILPEDVSVMFCGKLVKGEKSGEYEVKGRGRQPSFQFSVISRNVFASDDDVDGKKSRVITVDLEDIDLGFGL